MPVLDWIGKDKVVNHHNEVPYQVLESKYTYVRMSSLAAKVHEDFLRSQVGKCTEILVQKRTSPDYAEGLAPDYTPVRVYGSDAQRHDIIRVRLTGAGDGYCTGEEI